MEPQGNEGLLEFTENKVTYEDHDIPNLMVRHSMLTPKASKSEWWRNNIFKTRCSSHGRLCNIIIDERSCETLVSKEMVMKLNLLVLPHPKPYRISWFKKWGEIEVVQRCLVPFLIGKNYSYKVLCDVVEMGACHLLLARQW